MPTPISTYRFKWLLQLKDSIDPSYHAKKKYKTTLNEYIIDKKANKISSSDRKQEYKWFTDMDQWHGSRASVHNEISTSATKYWTKYVIPSIPTPSQTTTFIPST